MMLYKIIVLSKNRLKKMEINKEQKDLLVGVLERTINRLSMENSLEYGTDLGVLLEQAREIVEID